MYGLIEFNGSMHFFKTNPRFSACFKHFMLITYFFYQACYLQDFQPFKFSLSLAKMVND